jgi:phosphoribosylanthranilate isomerase
MARVKICGITRLVDLDAACTAGADALGFVFYAKSPRYLALDQAASLVRAVPAFVQTVGLFVDAEPAFVRAALEAVPLDLLQFHGEEAPGFCRQFGRPYLKAVRVREGIDLLEYERDYGDARALLLDAYVPGVPGGTGQRFDWQLIPPSLPLRLVLSGGLNPENVAEAIRTVHPWAVDVSSGVETAPGLKDAARVKAFVDAARNT